MLANADLSDEKQAQSIFSVTGEKIFKGWGQTSSSLRTTLSLTVAYWVFNLHKFPHKEQNRAADIRFNSVSIGVVSQLAQHPSSCRWQQIKTLLNSFLAWRGCLSSALACNQRNTLQKKRLRKLLHSGHVAASLLNISSILHLDSLHFSIWGCDIGPYTNPHNWTALLHTALFIQDCITAQKTRRSSPPLHFFPEAAKG